MENKNQDIAFEPKTIWAYRFVYWVDYDAKAQYCYVFAYSYKQAVFFWKKHYQSCYEWELDGTMHPIFLKHKHRVGEFWCGLYCDL